MNDRERTFDEILAPFRKEVEESGITDDELYDLFADERDQMHEERRWKEATEKGFPAEKELLDTLTHCRRTIPSDSGQHFFNLDLIRQIVRQWVKPNKWVKTLTGFSTTLYHDWFFDRFVPPEFRPA